MTKMIIGLLAVALGVTGSALTAKPKMKPYAAAAGYVYVKAANGGYNQLSISEYYPSFCDVSSNVICSYYVTETGAGIVTAAWYSDADIANFAYGYNAKLKYLPNGATDPYKGVYEEPVFE